MKCKVIDGDRDYLERVPEFVELYNNKNIKVATIKKRMKLGQAEYRGLFRHCREEGLLNLRVTKQRRVKQPGYKTNPLHYSQTVRGDNAHFTVSYRHEYYCACKTAKEASLIVERLKECNWDKKELPRIREEVKELIGDD